MRAVLVLLVPALLGVIIAGCLGGDGVPGLPDDVPAALRFTPAIAVTNDAPGGEPVIAVDSTGVVYIEGIGNGGNGNVNKVFRSTDGGGNWTDITPPLEGQDRSNDGFVAVGPDDAVYAANVFSLTFQVFRSDDKGATWTKLVLPPLPPLMHRHWIVFDDTGRMHVTVEALPPDFATWLVGVPPMFGPPGSPNEGLWYLWSDDRGDTWSVPQQIDAQVNFAGQGDLVVSPDGTRLYYPRYEEPDNGPYGQTYEAGHWYMILSEDGGATWDRHEMFDLTSELASAVMPLTMDANGTLYFAWTQLIGARSTNLYAHSTDGKTWSDPITLTPGRDTTQAMVWIEAREAGVLSAAWYESTAPGSAVQIDAPWTLGFARIHNATTTPMVATYNLTTDPVHHGNICAKGPACESGEDRSLIDYLWIDHGHDGAAHVTFASTEWDRPSAFPMFAREQVPARVA